MLCKSDGEVVSLNAAAVLCDVGRFEALVREGSRDALSAAADLYRGRLIDDVTIGEEGWNEWLTGERERLLELALGAMVGLGEQELAAGRAEHALKAGQRAIALNNMREDAHRLIVQALAATGRKAEALKHYQDLVALLKHELNTEPDAATRSLVAELRAHRAVERIARCQKIAKPAPPQPDRPSMVALPVDDMRRDLEEQSADDPVADGDAGLVRGGGPPREPRAATVDDHGLQRDRTLTALSARLDPEDMRDLIAAFHRAVADVVSRFDGFVAQYLSDGALVYFGYPAAHEHDAEQAVRAGLAILDAVGTLKARFRRDPSGERRHRHRACRRRRAAGDRRDTAARCDRRDAKPGGAAAGRGSARRGRDRGQHAAAGGADVRLPRARCDRGEGAAATGRGVAGARRDGRRQPVRGAARRRAVPARWPAGGDRAAAAPLGSGQARRGPGRAALGRARHRQVAHRRKPAGRLEGEPHARLRYFCSPHHTHSPLYPFIAQLERAAGFEPGSSVGAKLDRLEALLKPTAKNLPRDVALIAELLGVPTDERYPALAVSPQQKREMTLTALLDQLDGVAAQSPVLIVFEDVHWIDPTSLDLLDRMVARVANLPVLLVVTFRPEFAADLGRPAACDDAALEPSRPSRQRRHHWRRHRGTRRCPTQSSSRSLRARMACRCSSRN